MRLGVTQITQDTSYLKTPNSVTPGKPPFPNKVMFIGSGDSAVDISSGWGLEAQHLIHYNPQFPRSRPQPEVTSPPVGFHALTLVP